MRMMEINKAILENYLVDLYLQMSVSADIENLTQVRNMAFGVIQFCSRSGVIENCDHNKYLGTLNDTYSKLWIELKYAK